MNTLHPLTCQIAPKHMRRCSTSLIKRNKIPMRFSFILLDWKKIPKFDNTLSWQEKPYILTYCQQEYKVLQPPWQCIWQQNYICGFPLIQDLLSRNLFYNHTSINTKQHIHKIICDSIVYQKIEESQISNQQGIC